MWLDAPRCIWPPAAGRLSWWRSCSSMGLTRRPRTGTAGPLPAGPPPLVTTRWRNASTPRPHRPRRADAPRPGEAGLERSRRLDRGGLCSSDRIYPGRRADACSGLVYPAPSALRTARDRRTGRSRGRAARGPSHQAGAWRDLGIAQPRGAASATRGRGVGGPPGPRRTGEARLPTRLPRSFAAGHQADCRRDACATARTAGGTPALRRGAQAQVSASMPLFP